jgi:dihydrolipoamide dehydrogenase
VDAEVVRIVQKRLIARGATVLTEARALGAERSAAGVTLRVQHAGAEQVLSGSHLLVAAGFLPNSASLGLEALGVVLDAQGHIVTTERCETRVPGVYAIGDVSGAPYLAHKAFKEAEVVTDVLNGEPATRDWRAMPAAIFTDPEVATVGLTERQATERGLLLSVGRFPFSALGRAMALGESEGFVKLLAERGRLVGAAIVGAEASELITELTLAIEVGATLEDLALTVHSHPTLSEAIREAADAGLGRAVHIMNRKPRRAA